VHVWLVTVPACVLTVIVIGIGNEELIVVGFGETLHVLSVGIPEHSN
jgi:hypothetical protein